MAHEEPKQVIVERERRSPFGAIITAVLVIAVIAIVVMYGLPYLSGGNNSTTNVNIPAPTTGAGDVAPSN